MIPPLPAVQVLPHMRHFPEAHLVTWHPQGVLDGELVDQVLAIVESGEASAEQPFDRFTDLSGLTDIRLKFGNLFRISQHRRAVYPWKEPVKSAFFCESAVGYGFARMYESLMRHGPIHVRAFRTREASAEWLGVSLDLLLPET